MIGSLKTPIIAFSTSSSVWEQIAVAKRRFIETGIVPEPVPHLPEEVIEMWRLSRSHGIPWDHEFLLPRMPQDEFSLLLDKKQYLIDLFFDYVKTYSQILSSTKFDMNLCDENGVMLTLPMHFNKLKGWKYLISASGDIWDEKNVGCTAHTLALKYNRPVHIAGPVNYLKVLEENVTSAAPVTNEYGEIIGCIILSQEKANISNMLEHTLGWTIATAQALSSQVKLLRRSKRLKLMDSTLKATFDYAKDGFISIDEDCHIININNEAKRLLRADETKIRTKLSSLLEDSSYIFQSLKTGRSVKKQEIGIVNNQSVRVEFDISPFFNRNMRYSKGAIIKMVRKNDTFGLNKHGGSGNIAFENIISRSMVMEKLKNKAKTVAAKPVNILLLGESGTGKELFARAVHNFYNPKSPFVAINCASIPRTLIESELFGYEKGSFTGAERNGKKGKIEYADGGTLFLDEIGDMPLELQAVLLRVLEEREVVRVGGHKPVPVNFRVVAATNRPLAEDILNNRFRQDLYFRLSVVNLEIPSLRQRTDDILLLADHFIRTTCEHFCLPPYSLCPDTEEILREYCWPGNVRQLENAMIYAVTVAEKNIIKPSDLPDDIFEIQSRRRCSDLDDIRAAENEIILNTVKKTGNVQNAARYLGVSASTVYRKLKQINGGKILR